MNSTLLDSQVVLSEEFRGETSVATYVLKVLGVAFICVAEMLQVVKVLRSRKTKNKIVTGINALHFFLLFR